MTSIGRSAAFTFFFNAAADIADDPIPASHATTIFLMCVISNPLTPRLLSFVTAADALPDSWLPIASFGIADSPREVSPPLAIIRFTKNALTTKETAQD